MGPAGFRGEECKIPKPGPRGEPGIARPDGPPGVCVCGHLEAQIMCTNIIECLSWIALLQIRKTSSNVHM